MKLQEEFNRVSEQYDSQRRKLIPCFDDFYEMAVNNLTLTSSDPCILDLGAGTGLLSQRILEKYPTARLSLVDISEKMLEVARKRFPGNPRIKFSNEDLTQIQLSGRYDAIVSSLAIHHLNDTDKQILYHKIHQALVPGGIFVNAEQVLADTPFLENKYAAQWRNYVDASDLSAEEIEAAYERVKLDIRTPLSTQLQWLKDIGFENVDCLYKYYDFAVIWAQKQV